MTHDIDSNWEDLNEISDYAIDACDRSFGKPMVLSAPLEYRLGNQVGRILASLTGKPKKTHVQHRSMQDCLTHMEIMMEVSILE